MNIKNVLCRLFQAMLCIAIVICFSECKEERKISLTLKNSTIFFHQSGEGYLFSYQDNEKRVKASNVIMFTLTNSTEKRLLFIFDKDYFSTFGSTQDSAVSNIGIIIKDSNGKELLPMMPTGNPVSNLLSDTSLKVFFYKDSIKRARYKRLGVGSSEVSEVENYIKNSFILHPGESKTFKMELTLPIVSENDGITNYSSIFYTGLNSDQKLHLHYNCNAKALSKKLPFYLLNELKENEVEIFDGILDSNEIQLQKR